MKIAIGTDHRGFAHKEFIKQQMLFIKSVIFVRTALIVLITLLC